LDLPCARSSTTCPLADPRCAFFCCNHGTPATISTLSLHDALPISERYRAPETCDSVRDPNGLCRCSLRCNTSLPSEPDYNGANIDRKSTRLNSSHRTISYAVFCLKKKKAELRNLRNQTPSAPPADI